MKHPIKEGKEFDRLIPKSKNESVTLATGTTDLGLREMCKWAKKYQSQTQQLAQVLKGKTIAETVSNIHSFLYNHIQYLADGELQNLRSPQRSWADRQTGIDCKSYSIFAVTLLNNLGITAFYRKIKQPFFKPTEWTHVYVIVPKNQNTKSSANYYVLDATLPTNNEVPFKEKKDLIMESNLKYKGLNGVDATTQNDAVMANFYAFLQNMLDAGYAPNAVKTFQNSVETLLKSGKEPHLRFKKEGVFVNDVFIYIPKPFTTGLNTSRTVVSALPTPKNAGLDLSFGNSGGGNFNQSTNIGSGGFNFGNIGSFSNAAALIKKPLTGGATIALQAAGVPFAKQIVGTFSKLFASFGHSALNPTTQLAEIQKKQQQSDAFLTSINNKNINDVLDELSRYIQFQIDYFRNTLNRRKWAPKTQAALRLNTSEFLKYKQQKFEPFINSLKSSGYLVNISSKTESQNNLTTLYRPSDTYKTNNNITYPIYQVTIPKNLKNNNISQNNNSNVSNVSKAGFGLLGALVLVGLALGGGIKTTKKLNK